MLGAHRFSPDGKFLAGVMVPTFDIWVLDVERGSRSRLTFSGAVRGMAWSPDGTRIAYGNVNGDIYWKLANGAGKDELMLRGDGVPVLVYDWSSDGRVLLLGKGVGGPVAPRSLYTFEVSGSAGGLAPLLQSRATGAVQFFPSGKDSPRWFAYSTNESGAADEVYVQAMPGQQPGKWQASTASGAAPHWRADGRELFYLTSDGTMTAVDVRTSPAFQLGVPRRLFKAPAAPPGNPSAAWDVSVDGKKFLFTAAIEGATDVPIEVTVNWQELLKTK